MERRSDNYEYPLFDDWTTAELMEVLEFFFVILSVLIKILAGYNVSNFCKVIVIFKKNQPGSG